MEAPLPTFGTLEDEEEHRDIDPGAEIAAALDSATELHHDHILQQLAEPQQSPESNMLLDQVQMNSHLVMLDQDTVIDASRLVEIYHSLVAQLKYEKEIRTKLENADNFYKRQAESLRCQQGALINELVMPLREKVDRAAEQRDEMERQIEKKDSELKALKAYNVQLEAEIEQGEGWKDAEKALKKEVKKLKKELSRRSLESGELIRENLRLRTRTKTLEEDLNLSEKKIGVLKEEVVRCGGNLSVIDDLVARPTTIEADSAEKGDAKQQQQKSVVKTKTKRATSASTSAGEGKQGASSTAAENEEEEEEEDFDMAMQLEKEMEQALENGFDNGDVHNAGGNDDDVVMLKGHDEKSESGTTPKKVVQVDKDTASIEEPATKRKGRGQKKQLSNDDSKSKKQKKTSTTNGVEGSSSAQSAQEESTTADTVKNKKTKGSQKKAAATATTKRKGRPRRGKKGATTSEEDDDEEAQGEQTESGKGTDTGSVENDATTTTTKQKASRKRKAAPSSRASTVGRRRRTTAPPPQEEEEAKEEEEERPVDNDDDEFADMEKEMERALEEEKTNAADASTNDDSGSTGGGGDMYSSEVHGQTSVPEEDSTTGTKVQEEQSRAEDDEQHTAPAVSLPMTQAPSPDAAVASEGAVEGDDIDDGAVSGRGTRGRGRGRGSRGGNNNTKATTSAGRGRGKGTTKTTASTQQLETDGKKTTATASQEGEHVAEQAPTATTSPSTVRRSARLQKKNSNPDSLSKAQTPSVRQKKRKKTDDDGNDDDKERGEDGDDGVKDHEQSPDKKPEEKKEEGKEGEAGKQQEETKAAAENDVDEPSASEEPFFDLNIVPVAQQRHKLQPQPLTQSQQQRDEEQQTKVSSSESSSLIQVATVSVVVSNNISDINDTVSTQVTQREGTQEDVGLHEEESPQPPRQAPASAAGLTRSLDGMLMRSQNRVEHMMQMHLQPEEGLLSPIPEHYLAPLNVLSPHAGSVSIEPIHQLLGLSDDSEDEVQEEAEAKTTAANAKGHDNSSKVRPVSANTEIKPQPTTITTQQQTPPTNIVSQTTPHHGNILSSPGSSSTSSSTMMTSSPTTSPASSQVHEHPPPSTSSTSNVVASTIITTTKQRKQKASTPAPNTPAAAAVKVATPAKKQKTTHRTTPAIPTTVDGSSTTTTPTLAPATPMPIASSKAPISPTATSSSKLLSLPAPPLPSSVQNAAVANKPVHNVATTAPTPSPERQRNPQESQLAYVRRRLANGTQRELAEDFANDANVEAGVLVIALETALRERGNKSVVKLTDQHMFKDSTPLANKQEVKLMEMIWRIGELRGAAMQQQQTKSSPSAKSKGKGGDKQQTKENITNSFLEQLLRHLGIILVTRELRDFNKGERECLCRAFVCISRARGELMRVRVICYESLLVMDKDDLMMMTVEGTDGKSGTCLRSLVRFMLNMGQVWPAVLISNNNNNNGKDSTESIMIDTMRMILFRALKKTEDKQTQAVPYEEVAILCKAVGWDAYVSGSSGDDASLEALVLRFLELLKMHTTGGGSGSGGGSDSTTNTNVDLFNIMKAAALLAEWEGWEWTYNHFLVGGLWPLLSPEEPSAPSAIRAVGFLSRSAIEGQKRRRQRVKKRGGGTASKAAASKDECAAAAELEGLDWLKGSLALVLSSQDLRFPFAAQVAAVEALMDMTPTKALSSSSSISSSMTTTASSSSSSKTNKPKTRKAELISSSQEVKAWFRALTPTQRAQLPAVLK